MFAHNFRKYAPILINSQELFCKSQASYLAVELSFKVLTIFNLFSRYIMDTTTNASSEPKINKLKAFTYKI